MNSSEIVTAILDGDADFTLDAIVDAVALRRRKLARRLFLDLHEGDRVTINAHVKPKYMAGAIGTVIAKRESKVEVEFAEPMGRFGRRVIVPASALESTFLRKENA